MTTTAQDFGREFTPARQAQGFKSQDHLDAFYAAWDHVRNCPAGVCGTPGPSMWLDGSASWQPTERRCPQGQALDRKCADARNLRPLGGGDGVPD